MTQIIRTILLTALAVGCVTGSGGMEPTTEITCKDALANVGQVKIGITEARVLELLGQPTGIEKGVWG